MTLPAKNKLAIFLLLTGILLSGCGKAVTKTEGDKTNRTPALTASTEYLYNDGGRDIYDFRDMADVFIPARIKSLSETPQNSARLFLAEGAGEEAFYCDYHYQSSEGIYAFSKCHTFGDQSEEDKSVIDSKECRTCLSYQAGERIIITPGQSVRIDANSAVEVELEIDWH